ncbi:MAG: cyclic nucleotide-binding domain-containing protein [Oscillatoriophycideae cyanobacterium NC_groundwater_1537_Pr4_S-0.65um_50_18]|nr:cyclic nucleotide-binding domain-containing protein [Oscillatoriophycideae cyanobacterium NC_groundwater_1537_Pr4_S-0.65um_50_18]
MKKALYIMAAFSDRDFDWLMTAGRKKSVLAGSTLIREGEPTDALYIVLEGALSVSLEPGGKEIAKLGSGEVVGEMSFVDSRNPSATVKSAVDSLVWAIPRSQLAAKLSQDRDFASHFYHAIAVFLSDRLRDTMNPQGDREDSPEDMSPQVAKNIELAEARLGWLLSRLKQTF